MKRKILGTFLSRILVAFSSLVVLVITSRTLGPEVRGTISLLLLAMTITILINEIVAGPALVYFFPRTQHGRLLRYAFTWSALCAVSVPVTLYFLDLLPGEYLGWVMLIIILQSISAISMLYQLGTESASRYNMLAITQAAINPVILFSLIYFAEVNSIYSWLVAVAGAQLITAVTGIFFIRKFSVLQKTESHVSLRQLIEYGFMAQLSTLAYILSIRLSYYFLDNEDSRASVGVFSTGVSIMEAALLFSSSVALMTYSKISNSEDEEYNLRITTTLAKTTFMITVPLMLILLLIPESLYLIVLGKGFAGMKDVMLMLVPGISVISMSTIFTHYYAGKALYKVNVASSITGLLFSLLLGMILIPRFGITGASITTSCGYFASGLYTIIYFSRKNSTSIIRLLPSAGDLKQLASEIKKS